MAGAYAGTVSERVYVSTDKDVYVAGDIIWCSAFCVDASSGKLSSASSVVYVELSSTAGTVATCKIALIDGRGSGSMPIPVSAPTGNYMLLGYTSAEKGRADLQSDSKVISVFSTLGTDRVPGGVEVIGADEYALLKPAPAQIQGNLQVSLEGPSGKSSVSKVRLMNRMPSAATLSLSVSCDDGIVAPSPHDISDFLKVRTDFEGEAVDSEGEVFHGRLIGETVPGSVPLQSLTAAVAFPGLANDLYVSRFNPDGTILFKTVNVYGNRDMVCEIVGAGPGVDHRIVIESPFLEVKVTDIPTLKLSTSMEQALIMRSKAMQFDRKADTDTLYEFMPKRESTLLSDTYCLVYHLDDYVRFATVQETLIEITPELRVRKDSGGEPQMRMLVQDVDRQIFSSDVLTMIDGVPVNDLQGLLDFDCHLLSDILIYPYTYMFGDVTYKGMVDFVTAKGDISSFKFGRNVVIVDWQGESYPVAYTCRNLDQTGEDLRGTLYWHPQIELEPGESVTIEVRTPSYPGNFNIVAEGITTDGQPIRSGTSFGIR